MASQDEIILLAGGNDDNSWKGTGHLLENYEEGYTISSSSNGPQNNNSNVLNSNLSFLNGTWMNNSSSQKDEFLIFRFPTPVTITSYKMWETKDRHLSYPPINWELHSLTMFGNMDQFIHNDNLDPNFWYNKINDLTFIKQVNAETIDGYDQVSRKYTNAKSINDDEQFHEYKIDSSQRKKGNILIMYFPYPFSRINKDLSKENPAVTIGGLAFYGIKHPHDKNGFIDIIHNFDVIGIHEKKYRVMPLKISDISNTYDDFFNILSQQPWYNDIELTKAVSNTVGFIKEDDKDIMNYDYFFDIYFGPLFCYDIDSKSLKYKKIYSNEDSNVIQGPPAMTDFPRSPSLFQKILSLKDSLLTNDGEGFTSGRKGFYQRRQVPGYINAEKNGGGWGAPTAAHPTKYTIPENWNGVEFGDGQHDGKKLPNTDSRNYLADNNGYAEHVWYDYKFSSQDKGPLIEKVMTGPYDEFLEVTEGTYIYGHALNFGGSRGVRTLVNPYTFANYDIFNVGDDKGGGSNISVWIKAIEHFGNGNFFSNMRQSHFSGGLGGIYKAGESQGGGGGGIDEDGYIMWKLDASYSHITVEFATNTFPRTRDQVMSHGWWEAGHNEASNNQKAGKFDPNTKDITLGEQTNKLQGFTALYAQSESSVKLHENWEVGFVSQNSSRHALTSTSANGYRTKNDLTSFYGVPCRLSIKDPLNDETITINASEFHAIDERSVDSANSQLPILEPPGSTIGSGGALREHNWVKLLNETSNNSQDVKDWLTDCSRNYWDNLPARFPVPASWRGPPHDPDMVSDSEVARRMNNYANGIGGENESPWSELYMWYKTLAPDLHGPIGGAYWPRLVRYAYKPSMADGGSGNTDDVTSPLDPFGVNTSKFRELVKIDEINTKKIYSSSYRDMSLNAGNWMMLLERISIIFGVEITYSTGDPESISDGFSSWQQSDANTNNPKYLDLSDNEIIMVSYEDHIEDLTSETTVKVIEDKYYLFNYDNIDTSFNYLRKYGLKNDTTYILKNIQDDYAIRIIDDNNTNLITYEGDQSKKITHNGNDYYYGDVSVNVVGNFGQVSIESINNGYINGYINGEYLFQYNDDDWDVKHNYVPQHIPSSSQIFNSSSITSTDLQGNDNNYYTSIDIPNNITSIGSNVFKNNHFSDISFEITSQLTFIGPKAFFTEIVPISEVAKPLTLIIPDSVTDISDSAFENCKIDNLIIGNNVTSIGKRAFKNNDISSLTIPNSVTYIGEEAFTNNNITSLIIPNNVTTIKLNAFTGNKITFLQVPRNLYPRGFSNGYNHERNNDPNTPPLYGALPWFKRSNSDNTSFDQALPPILPWWDDSYTQDPLDNRDRRILDDRDSDGDYDVYEHLWLADYKVRRKQLGSTHPISDLSFALSYNPNDPAPDISDQLIVYT